MEGSIAEEGARMKEGGDACRRRARGRDWQRFFNGRQMMTATDLSGRVALVTGAGVGIRRATVEGGGS
jgi:hypothetical protein